MLLLLGIIQTDEKKWSARQCLLFVRGRLRWEGMHIRMELHITRYCLDIKMTQGDI